MPGKSKPVRQGTEKKNSYPRIAVETTSTDRKAKINFPKTEPLIKAFRMFLSLKRLWGRV